MARKAIRIIVLTISLGAFIACTAYFINHYLQKKKIDNLREEVSISSEESSSQQEKPEVSVPIDFENLQKANSDIYAWITIPNTPVDYPILQSENDNAFYLNHTVNGKKSLYGSIYTEDFNNKDFSDFNTLVYGHNMKNGTMFGSLKKFRDASFFNENRFIIVYMPNRILKYEIFAACTWDNKHILANRNFEDENNRQVYLDEIFAVRDAKSQIAKDMEVTPTDRIITLSTCMGIKENRLIVSGVLIYDSAED